MRLLDDREGLLSPAVLYFTALSKPFLNSERVSEETRLCLNVQYVPSAAIRAVVSSRKYTKGRAWRAEMGVQTEDEISQNFGEWND